MTTTNTNLAPPIASDAWERWSPMPQMTPIFHKATEGDAACLTITANGRRQMDGRWICSAIPILAGTTYRISVQYSCEDHDEDANTVHALATWNDADGKLLQADYLTEASGQPDGWIELSLTEQAPPEAGQLQLELIFFRTASGKVKWRQPVAAETSPLAPRKVKVATTFLRIDNDPQATVDSHVRTMLELADEAGRQGADIICFSELMIRPDGVPLMEAAQTIPGPVTEAFCRKAREIGAYIIVNIHEKDTEGFLYNTSVLIGRAGEIEGKYRKVHLTVTEAKNGINPGCDYPVFDTDFGRIGMLVCWDHFFPESARMMRLQGCEIVFVSTKGDAVKQCLADSIANGQYMVVAGWNGDKPSRIVNPQGVILAESTHPEREVLVEELDLNERFRTLWLSVGPGYGEGRSLYEEERRPNTYNELNRRSRRHR
ncbi:carbon-nitrogen hydrolase family protein [Paenibacillus chungangensis]|uniref:Carbon-nitrogen hydrolase family protein n=1 Tax=Paenibacillus chungangensis TaxID=696535 RepID=A0ABW3HVB9_9BACL